MKTCIECGLTLQLDDFYNHPNAKDGHAGVCKSCHKSRMKVRRLTSPYVQEYDRMRHQRPERKQYGIQNARRWREQNPQAYKAQTAVNNAIRDGRLRKGPCSFCGTAKHVHGHHHDYSKPLTVTWLCAKCHHRLHASFPELGGHFQEAAE